MNDKEVRIELRFSPQQVEYIGNVLAQRPYAEVAAVIADIQAQLQEQQQGGGGRPPVQPLAVVPATP